MNILFVCTGNACRSILAEAIFNALAPPGMHAMSAGTHPAGYVHPRTIALLQRSGISTDGCHSKSWHDLPAVPDIAITVCDYAAGETCPALLSLAVRGHWGVADPGRATGTPAEIEASFEHAYHTLRARIEALLALPLAELRQSPKQLAEQLLRIGQIGT